MNFDGGGQDPLTEGGLALIFREGFEVQLNRFANVGDRLVDGPFLRAFQLRTPDIEAVFCFCLFCFLPVLLLPCTPSLTLLP